MTEAETEQNVEAARASIGRVRAALQRAFLGQEHVVEDLLIVLLSGGHALLEGVPGVGKTSLVRTLASILDTSFGRVQFTPDLVPSDVLGTRILEEDGGHRRFVFQPGPIFANVVLADEINRATPRTQSALLEAMQERAVTAFGETMRLPTPFLVFATENPIEMEGTFPLPEAQLDRFLFKVRVNAPSVDELVAILELTSGWPDDSHPSTEQPAASAGDILGIQRLVREIPASSEIVRRIALLIESSNPTSTSCPPSVKQATRHGASPRGGQAVLVAARANAFMHGRLHVAAEDVRRVTGPALRHRLLLNYEAAATGVDVDGLVGDLLNLHF